MLTTIKQEAAVCAALVCVACLAGCDDGCSAQFGENVSAADAITLIECRQGEPSFVILDVRTPEEFAQGHLKDAVNLDFRSADFAEQIGFLDRENTCLVYCQGGGRSAQAVEMMRARGFTSIHNLEGGYTAFSQLEAADDLVALPCLPCSQSFVAAAFWPGDSTNETRSIFFVGADLRSACEPITDRFLHGGGGRQPWTSSLE